METSPPKRRALMPLDANITSSPAGTKTHSPTKFSGYPPTTGGYFAATASSENGTAKRCVEDLLEQPPAKRACLQELIPNTMPASTSSMPQAVHTSTEGDAFGPTSTTSQPQQDARRSPSPAESSSLFDTSTLDDSQATALTEPDSDAATTQASAGLLPLTREQTRRHADTLRLRLGLASYKLRTGQVDIPLERLQIRRTLGGNPDAETLRLGGEFASSVARGHRRERSTGSTMSDDDEGHQSDESNRLSLAARKPLPAGPRGRVAQVQAMSSALLSSTRSYRSPEKTASPRLPPSSFETPKRPQDRRDDDDESDWDGLTSSAVRGGAAKGLLSLSRG